MIKPGISKIGFVEQNEIDDHWIQQEEQEQVERGGTQTGTIPNIHLFQSIDQSKSEIRENSSEDENGQVFEVALSFVVRQQRDIDLGKKYLNRPLVLYVWMVDGNLYTIGTKTYPVHLESNNIYENTTTRELKMTVRYQSRVSLLK